VTWIDSPNGGHLTLERVKFSPSPKKSTFESPGNPRKKKTTESQTATDLGLLDLFLNLFLLVFLEEVPKLRRKDQFLK